MAIREQDIVILESAIMRDVPAAWRLHISTSSRESTAMLFLTVFGIS